MFIQVYSQCVHYLFHLEYFTDVTFGEEQVKWQWMAWIELECLFLKRKGIGPYMAENYLLLDDTKELPNFNATGRKVSVLCVYILIISWKTIAKGKLTGKIVKKNSNKTPA